GGPPARCIRPGLRDAEGMDHAAGGFAPKLVVGGPHRPTGSFRNRRVTYVRRIARAVRVLVSRRRRPPRDARDRGRATRHGRAGARRSRRPLWRATLSPGGHGG